MLPGIIEMLPSGAVAANRSTPEVCLVRVADPDGAILDGVVFAHAAPCRFMRVKPCDSMPLSLSPADPAPYSVAYTSTSVTVSLDHMSIYLWITCSADCGIVTIKVEPQPV